MASFSYSSILVALSVFALALALRPASVDANFYESIYFNWGGQQSAISGNGEDLNLVLDKTSGSGIQSYQAFLFGSIEMLVKLVPGNSAGTVTAYYVSSTGDRHDEIDFEFLGNVSGQPYIIHTNVFVQGNGSREQWYVDSVPIRVYRNYESQGVPFPNKQGMTVYSSLWNADNWATRGGLEKIDWNSAPFVAKYRDFRARACRWNGPSSINQCAVNSPANWWTSPEYKQLSYAKQGQMKWVRDNYMMYDYCRDYKRFNGNMPPECFKPQF
ncbi:unnamed protein product [Linum tenue]|uniref:Xyloglucan endotransglucosylase/hydrolase n=1 Tax=Linum tenue TaxID=586396 RepID=A0AAV0HYD6_9ROSI|nr:unnamed protein product [Linum tenue]